MQKLIGYCTLGVGIYLFLNEQVLWGVVMFVLGGAITNGADNGVWLCFHSDDDGCDGSDGGDGGD
jgi:hypothetical protein